MLELPYKELERERSKLKQAGACPVPGISPQLSGAADKYKPPEEPDMLNSGPLAQAYPVALTIPASTLITYH